MARTKGSKGRKTLAREMGLTLEEYNSLQESKKFKLDEVEKKENSGDVKLQEISEEKNNQENPKNIKTLTDKSICEDKKSKKIQKNLPECSRCHQFIMGGTPAKINLTYITTQASYHRQVSDDRPILCFNCINKLNKLIDDFLLDDESGIPRKFKID